MGWLKMDRNDLGQKNATCLGVKISNIIKPDPEFHTRNHTVEVGGPILDDFNILTLYQNS